MLRFTRARIGVLCDFDLVGMEGSILGAQLSQQRCA